MRSFIIMLCVNTVGLVGMQSPRTSYDPVSLLFLAAEKNDPMLAQKAIESGALIDAQDDEKNTPLHWAAKYGSIRMIAWLIQHGAAIDAHNYYQFTPLHMAARCGKILAIESLLAFGAIIDAPDKIGETPLHRTASTYEFNSARALLAAGAPANVTTREGKTPLHLAAFNDDVIVIELLAEYGAYLTPEAGGIMPFHVAMSRHAHNALRWLIQNGAPFDKRTFSIRQYLLEHIILKPIVLEALYGNYERIDQFLNESFWATHENIEIIQDVFYLAGAHGYVDIVNAIFTFNATIIEETILKKTLLAAALSGHEAIVQIILEHSKPLRKSQSDWNNTLEKALLRATAQRHVKVAEALIKIGTNMAPAKNRIASILKNKRLPPKIRDQYLTMFIYMHELTRLPGILNLSTNPTPTVNFITALPSEIRMMIYYLIIRPLNEKLIL